MALVELTGIGRSYMVGGGELKVLKDVSLTIEEGEFVAIIGPSGSGKSTLMQILGLLDRPTYGTYRLVGHDVSQLTDDEGAALRSKTIGFIFQMFNLLARTSTLDNVMLPMIYSGAPNREARAQELLKDLGLGDRMDHKPNQLSGGQQQRVAIARALVNRPRILFADEPTGNLASDQAEDILRQMELLNRSGITVIIVTHDPDIAQHARRVIHIKDGKIVSDERKNETTNSQPSSPAVISGGSIMAVKRHDGSRLTIRRDDSPLEHPQFSFAEFREFANSALRAITANKVRSGLSMLGILIGVGSVIAMLAIGKGAQKAIEARLQSLGSNVVMMFAGSPSTRGVRGPVGNFSRLTLEDVRAIQRIPNVADMYGEVEGNVRIVYNDKNSLSEIQGVPVSYVSIRNAAPYFGRFFTDQEDHDLSRVILLGQTVVRDLFGSENPVGQFVKLNHADYKVIGILPIKGSSGFSDQDDISVVPIHTAMSRVLGTVYLHEMAIQCATLEAIPQMMADIKQLMRKRHRLPPLKEDDFTLRNNAEVQSTLSDTTQTFSLLLGIVAAISLFVGGVGIMNIMLVSVNERTREIGLRKAVGAARRAILAQFLLESVVLSTLGGLLGTAFGMMVAFLMSKFAGWGAEVTPQSVILAFAFSAGIGILFGFWPARKASLLSPIEALRYE
jgi:macrolide transport system ATP-binding/permease protein